jgi:hypothetical protein
LDTTPEIEFESSLTRVYKSGTNLNIVAQETSNSDVQIGADDWIEIEADNSILLEADSGKVQIFANDGVGIQESSPGFDLEVNGTAGKPGGGSWSNSSDLRLKTAIRDIDGATALELLSRLHGVHYEWIHPELHEPGVRAGVIAQEVQEVFADWVHEAQPRGDDIELVGAGEPVLAVAFPHDFNAYLIEAIQHLAEEVERLQEEVERLQEATSER